LKVTGPARRFETRSSEEHRTFARALFARDDVDEVLGPETGKQAKKSTHKTRTGYRPLPQSSARIIACVALPFNLRRDAFGDNFCP